MKISKKLPDWVVGLAVTLVFLFVTTTGIFDFTAALEVKTLDLRSRITASGERDPDIELVVVTDNDISELGPYPWPRDVLALCIDNLALAGAKVIALNILLGEPQEGPGLKAVKNLRASYELSGLAQKGAGLVFYKELSKALTGLDNDSKLVKAMEKAGNVVLPIRFDLQSRSHDLKAPDVVSRHVFERTEGLDIEGTRYVLKWFSKLERLSPAFAEVAAGIGHVNFFEDKDGTVRNQAHVLGYLKDSYVPSFSLAIVKAFKNLKNEDMTAVFGEGINLRISPSSVVNVPVIDSHMRTPIKWNEGPAVGFHQTPFVKVLKNQVQTSLFRDKIVIIGATAPGIRNRVATPISANLPAVEVVANSVENILNQNFIYRPDWLPIIEFFILAVFGFFITFVLPRMNAELGAFTSLGLVVGYFGMGTAVFLFSGTWLSVAPSILLLVVGYVLLISKRFLSAKKTQENREAHSSELHALTGFPSRTQGSFDLVLEEFRRLPLEEGETKELLYTLGLGYEQNGQFSNALATYGLIMVRGGNFKDLNERVHRLENRNASLSAGAWAGRQDDEGTPVDMETKRPFERYELMRELGRGKTGVVYEAQDTRTKQIVALKAVKLEDFGEGMADEVADRIFRETESAGLLTHPNIVSVYDFGIENGLVYISMEYVEGQNLGHYTRPGRLLPLRETLSIVAGVADTLEYAHSKGVVHGDLKPANVIRIEKTRDVKLTDFGIARVMPSSKHKSGMGPGFPYYMSPEQLSGKRSDGRSDVFSVGVLLFEMLTGQKPFKGDDISALMLSIARDKHPSAKALNPRVPRIVERILDRSLEKDMERRYQRAGLMAGQLRKVVGKIDEVMAQKKAGF
jgi:serine/threonine-protein kinase